MIIVAFLLGLGIGGWGYLVVAFLKERRDRLRVDPKNLRVICGCQS